jgi:thymidylate synthase
MAWKTMVTELLWFLRGDTNIKYLVDNNCHIWDGDAYKRYSVIAGVSTQVETLTQEEFINKIKTDDEFAKKWGSLGPVYGKQWRSWDVPKILTIEKGKIENSIGTEWGSWERNPIDQIANLISELKTNPDSRRLMVNAWNVGEIDKMVLPPCHYGFQVYTRELSLEERKVIAKKVLPILNTFLGNQSEEGWIEQCEKLNIPTRAISLMYNCRSQDVPLGTPFNISSYALLLEIIAKMVNMVSDELIANMGDCHIYLNQIDGVKEQLIREPYSLPKLVISNQVNFNEGIDEFLNSCLISDFQIEGYQSHSTIKMPLSN